MNKQKQQRCNKSLNIVKLSLKTHKKWLIN